ncbi:hypothetical protein D9R14_07470 [Xanthobacter tagetidis]|uniref:CopG family transcriptional regulator n=1 Tax=Xanthobacter tagetidis TaxID=60216 RepID=A0A3L7AHR6_9HYPH|nr:hypothetical protein D9R14_07470 [Xanthobacter tagetidis]
MSRSTEKMQPQKRGRPATGKGTPIQVRLRPEVLSILDDWIAAQPDPKPSRPAAIRSFVEAGLHMLEKDRGA